MNHESDPDLPQSNIERGEADPGSVSAGMTVVEIEGQQILEAAPLEGDVRNYARAKLRPHLDAYLERVATEAVKGGRRSETSTKMFADIMGLREKMQILNLFIDRLGVDEQTARQAVELKRRLDNLDEDQISDMIARSLAAYLARKPERRPRLLQLLGVGIDNAAANGVGSAQ